MPTPQRHPTPKPQRRPAAGSRNRRHIPPILIRIYDTIRGNILLRNLVMALCLGIILYFIINLSLGIYTRHGQKFIVPQMIGHTLTEAETMAAKGELRIEVIDSLYMPKQRPGQILDQSPKPGMGVKKGRRIFLTINASRPRMDIIPYVTGYSLRQAKNMLETKGFEIEKLVYRSDMATNNVLDELYNGISITQGSRTEAELGSGITLIVGVNHSSPLPRIPKVIGLTLREAKSRLWEVGLNVGRIRYDSGIDGTETEDARVYRQEPNQQSRTDYGGKISLWLTLDTRKITSSSKESDAAARRYAVEEEEEETGDMQLEEEADAR
ncbi:PASTA domain-containing protein [uncultured Rikenella sp.]|uniref:PASTA domain-containing protein n=1 Tax=uncultured Rikenella sp. TaxID=368003 RepID=UPI002630D46D|nr:PASTA domain-containing protein [uncultured Rikenella sp.]